MSVKPIYEFEYVTYGETVTPDALNGSVYWYDTGIEYNGEAVFKDTSDTYARWKDASGWVTTLDSEIGEALGDYFSEDGAELTGEGSWSGTLTRNENTISDSWYRAETEAFESLVAFVGAAPGVDCFRGFLPVQGDGEDLLSVNVWQMTSGDSIEFEMDRIYGTDANWCSLRSDARIESVWETREKAMKFAGAVTAWLKSTDNLNEVGNITWCTMADIPSEPEIYRTSGLKNRERYWRQTIPLELVYKTESVYN